MNGRNRSFQRLWLTTYPWLVYSKSQDGGYCLPCVLFSPPGAGNRGVLVKTPFKRWTKVSDVCRGHSTAKYHLDAQVAYDNFKTTAAQPEKTVAAQLDQKKRETIAKNRSLLKSLSKTVYLCGRQGIALHGHRDDSTAHPDANHGNFLELLRFRIDGGDEVLRDHFASHQRNASYSSKTVQNQLLTIIGDQIRDNIVNDVKASRFYSILANEVSDAAGLEQISLVLRFVDQEHRIREEFVDFIAVDRIIGTVLAAAITKAVEPYGLSISDCRGQGYDGASNMSSAIRGVQGIISQSAPHATYVHCNCHALNLAIVKACSLPPIRNMAGSVSEAAKFFNYSPKRQCLREKVIEATQPEVKKEKLHDLCRTRWIERHHAYEVFTDLYPSVVTTLDVIMLNESGNPEYGEWNWDREIVSPRLTAFTGR